MMFLAFMLTVFHWVLLSSMTACLIVPIILLTKLAVKDRLSPSWHYFIWFLLLVKLAIPLWPSSYFSVQNIVPSFEHVVLNTYHKYDAKFSAEGGTMSVSGKPLATNLGFGSNSVIHREPASVATMSHNDHVAGTDAAGTNAAGTNIEFVVLLIWLLGTGTFGFRVMFLNGRLLLAIRSNAQEAQERERGVLQETKRLLGIRADIPLLITSEVKAPVLFGLVRPVLLLPVSIIDKVDSNELRHIFLHELTHFKRMDFAVNALVILLKTIHWFNPLVGYAFYIMRQDGEVACDVRVVSGMEPEERFNYGYTMIHLLQIARPQSTPGMTGIMEKRPKMERRSLIASWKKRSVKSMVLGTVLLLGLGLITLTGAKIGVAAQITPLNQNGSHQVTTSGTGESGSRGVAGSAGNASPCLLNIQGKNFAGQFTGKMMVVPNPLKIDLGFSLKGSKPNETTSEMAKENKAVGAINAGSSYTDSVSGPAVSAVGLVVKDGKTILNDLKDDHASQNVVSLTQGGRLVVGKQTLSELMQNCVKEAISSGPALIVNGIAQKTTDSWGVGCQSAIGQESDGTVILLAINGRSKESVGASLQDVQNILLNHGVLNAALLDGGSLSTMYYNGNVVNDPPNGEQVVPCAFLVMP